MWPLEVLFFFPDRRGSSALFLTHFTQIQPVTPSTRSSPVVRLSTQTKSTHPSLLTFFHKEAVRPVDAEMEADQTLTLEHKKLLLDVLQSLVFVLSNISLLLVAALLPCAFRSCTEARQGHVVILKAGVWSPLPLPLPLRGEEGVLEAHTGGRGLQNETGGDSGECKDKLRLRLSKSGFLFPANTYKSTLHLFREIFI